MAAGQCSGPRQPATASGSGRTAAQRGQHPRPETPPCTRISDMRDSDGRLGCATHMRDSDARLGLRLPCDKGLGGAACHPEIRMMARTGRRGDTKDGPNGWPGQTTGPNGRPGKKTGRHGWPERAAGEEDRPAWMARTGSRGPRKPNCGPRKPRAAPPVGLGPGGRLRSPARVADSDGRC